MVERMTDLEWLYMNMMEAFQRLNKQTTVFNSAKAKRAFDAWYDACERELALTLPPHLLKGA